jgi:hypothetical protein
VWKRSVHAVQRQYLPSTIVGTTLDFAFERVADHTDARRRFADLWDGAEFYRAADEFHDRLAGLPIRCSYEQLSLCAGVFVFDRASKDAA